MPGNADTETKDQIDDVGGTASLVEPVPSIQTLERLGSYLGRYQERLVDAVQEADDVEESHRAATYALMHAETAVRRMADQDGERVPVSAFESGEVDDRGRVALGPQYADETVYVAVLREQDVPGR